jgi:electron transfer flavoprotein beta subunit
MPAEIVVLVSVGRHPASGRARRAELDARAVELALRCADATVRLLHAGAAESCLADYLGMGAAGLDVLDVPPEADPVPVLAAHLAERRPELILAGARAEAGEGSGMVPYLVAQALDLPIVAQAAGIVPEGGNTWIVQALPGGKRRLLRAAGPVVAAVDVAAPEPRMSAYARARRGQIGHLPPATIVAGDTSDWLVEPARPRPKRIMAQVKGSAADRMAALMQGGRRPGAEAKRPLVGLSPDQAAEAIADYLAREGLSSAGKGGHRPT